jgi:hypothetical protein
VAAEASVGASVGASVAGTAVSVGSEAGASVGWLVHAASNPTIRMRRANLTIIDFIFLFS